jgi:ATP-dependent RNA helicase DOB1
VQAFSSGTIWPTPCCLRCLEPTLRLQGKPNPLLSSFRLSYYTLLNLLKRVEGGTDSLEYVIAHSFQQFQQESARPRVGAQRAVLCRS